MRLRLQRPPSRDELRRLTPHELIRDFPETLAVFRARSVRLPAIGGRRLDSLTGGAANDVEGLVADLGRALAWRREE